MKSSRCSLTEIQRRIDEVMRFLSVTLAIANAHTVEFYTHDVWKRFIAVTPQEVLAAVSSGSDQQGEPKHKEKGKYRQDVREKQCMPGKKCQFPLNFFSRYIKTKIIIIIRILYDSA